LKKKGRKAREGGENMTLYTEKDVYASYTSGGSLVKASEINLEIYRALNAKEEKARAKGDTEAVVFFATQKGRVPQHSDELLEMIESGEYPEISYDAPGKGKGAHGETEEQETGEGLSLAEMKEKIRKEKKGAKTKILISIPEKDMVFILSRKPYGESMNSFLCRMMTEGAKGV
jgi:hypothetical protein